MSLVYQMILEVLVGYVYNRPVALRLDARGHTPVQKREDAVLDIKP